MQKQFDADTNNPPQPVSTSNSTTSSAQLAQCANNSSENPLNTKGRAESSPPDELIAYILEITPVRANRSNISSYCNVTFQSSAAFHRAVCFSRTKPLFVERQKSKTAVKLQRFNFAKDGKTIFINDMTKVSTPSSSEYNFQYQQMCYPLFHSLRAVVDSTAEMDLTSCCGKIVFKGKDVETVSAANLKKVDCYIADETAMLKLILWEEHIQTTSVGEVYTFQNVRIRENSDEKNGRLINTTLQTTIFKTDNLTLERRDAFDNIPLLEVDPKAPQCMQLNVKRIDSIEELSRFKQCRKCLKKIQQDDSSKITKCDHCGNIFRSSSCQVVTLVKFLVENNDKSGDDKYTRSRCVAKNGRFNRWCKR